MSTFSLELKLNICSKFTNHVYLEGENESTKNQVRKILSSYSTLAIFNEVYSDQRN